jgi:hypothetical protein
MVVAFGVVCWLWLRPSALGLLIAAVGLVAMLWLIWSRRFEKGGDTTLTGAG